MIKTLASAIMAFFVVATLGISLLTIVPVPDVEARRKHDCRHEHLIWNEHRNRWVKREHNDWRWHDHNNVHVFTCGCHN